MASAVRSAQESLAHANEISSPARYIRPHQPESTPSHSLEFTADSQTPRCPPFRRNSPRHRPWLTVHLEMPVPIGLQQRTLIMSGRRTILSSSSRRCRSDRTARQLAGLPDPAIFDRFPTRKYSLLAGAVLEDRVVVAGRRLVRAGDLQIDFVVAPRDETSRRYAHTVMGFCPSPDVPAPSGITSRFRRSPLIAVPLAVVVHVRKPQGGGVLGRTCRRQIGRCATRLVRRSGRCAWADCTLMW